MTCATSISTLTSAGVYFVHVIDPRTIQLVPTLNQALNPGQAIRTFTKSAITGGTTFTITGTNAFTAADNGLAVTYHSPTPVTFYSAMVNVDASVDSNNLVTLADHPGQNNIYFVDANGNPVADGFNSGDVVTYHVSSGTSGVTGTAVGGLVDGRAYRVVTVNANSIQLKPNTAVTTTVNFVP